MRGPMATNDDDRRLNLVVLGIMLVSLTALIALGALLLYGIHGVRTDEGKPAITVMEPSGSKQATFSSEASVPNDDAEGLEAPEESVDDDPYASGLDYESAVGAVDALLTALRDGDVERMEKVTTDYFKTDAPDYFSPHADALLDFEVTDAFEHGAVYVVVMREEWETGSKEVTYIVISENGRALVDEVGF